MSVALKKSPYIRTGKLFFTFTEPYVPFISYRKRMLRPILGIIGCSIGQRTIRKQMSMQKDGKRQMKKETHNRQ